MRDQQDGKRKPASELAQQIQYPRLHRNVERAYRLVGDEQLRLAGQRAGDARALTLTAGQFARILFEHRFGKPYRLQQRTGIGKQRVRRRRTAEIKRLFQRRADAHPRIEAAYGILKNHLHRTRVHRKLPAARFLQPRESPRQRGFAAAGLSDNTEDLPRFHIERDAVDDFATAVADAQILYFNKALHFASSALSLALTLFFAAAKRAR